MDELAAVDEADGGTGHAELHLELERQVATDPVTGLPNRVRFMDDLTRAIAAATRYDEPLSLLVLDLADRDADEQAAGEALLRLVRITDIVARIAPGRFAIILPRTGTIGCALVAARVLGTRRACVHRRERDVRGRADGRGGAARPRRGRSGRSALLSSSGDLDAVDRDRRRRPVAAVAVDVRDAVDDVLPRRDLAEDGVLAVEPRRRLGGDDEELRAVRVRARSSPSRARP